MAIEKMNGEMVGKRAVRTNWASRRMAATSNNNQTQQQLNQNDGLETAGILILSDEEKNISNESQEERQKQLYERVYNSTDSDNTTVYLGNLGTAEQPRLLTGIIFFNITIQICALNNIYF